MTKSFSTNNSSGKIRVVDPDPEVFGPSGSGSVIICTDPDPDYFFMVILNEPDEKRRIRSGSVTPVVRIHNTGKNT
jgi:hypothetical protein